MAEFHETLQELRRQKELTQEELAAALFVSRTAVSKWEQGRGYPNIDSLKAISTFFGVSIDDLLSGEEVLTIAHEDRRQQTARLRDVVFGLLDCSTVLLGLLPLFGQEVNSTVHSVSLLTLTAVAPWLKIAYIAIVGGAMLFGVTTLALQSCDRPSWVRIKHPLSLALSAVGCLLFILSRQPYAASFLFIFLAVKAWMLFKSR